MLGTTNAHGLERKARYGEQCLEEPDDASEGAALMTQVNGLLQLLWIKHPPLAAAPTTSIHQGSATGQQLVGAAQPDPGLPPRSARGSASWIFRHTSHTRLTAVSRVWVWACISCEASGSEERPGP